MLAILMNSLGIYINSINISVSIEMQILNEDESIMFSGLNSTSVLIFVVSVFFAFEIRFFKSGLKSYSG